jgi:adenylylsulfate reductase subunit B
MWAIQFRNGEVKRFKFPIRTTPWGSIDATMGFPPPQASEFRSQHLHGEPKWLFVDALPSISS